MKAMVKSTKKIVEIIPTTKENTLVFSSVNNPEIVFNSSDLDFNQLTWNATPKVIQDNLYTTSVSIEVKPEIKMDMTRTKVKKKKASKN